MVEEETRGRCCPGAPGPGDLESGRRRILAVLLPPLVHRLNNSLAVIHGTLETAGIRLDPARLQSARREAQRMSHALSRASLFAKEHRPSEASFALAGVLRASEVLLRPLAESRGVELESGQVARGVVLRGDESRLEQLWVHLVAEAILALAASREGSTSQPGPRLRISLTRGVALRLALVGLSPAATGELRRLDQGIEGPAAELGIRAVRLRLGASSGGLSLSFREALVASAPETPAGGVAGIWEGRVLLIEPFPEIGELLRDVLAEQGLEARHVLDVETAGKLLMDEAWDLVILDTEIEALSPGLLEMLRASRWALEDRLGVMDDGRQALDLGGLVVLEKPIRPAHLLGFVGERLGLATRT